METLSKYRKPALLALGLGVLGYLGYQKRGAISKLIQNSNELRLSVDIGFKRLHAFKGSLLAPKAEIIFSVNILNVTGFDMTLQDIFIKVQAYKAGKWVDIGRSKDVLPEWILKNSKDNLKEINISIDLLPLIATLTDKAGKFRTLTYYGVNEMAMPEIAEELELGRYLNVASLQKKILEMIGKKPVAGIAPASINNLLI